MPGCGPAGVERATDTYHPTIIPRTSDPTTTPASPHVSRDTPQITTQPATGGGKSGPRPNHNTGMGVHQLCQDELVTDPNVPRMWGAASTISEGYRPAAHTADEPAGRASSPNDRAGSASTQTAAPTQRPASHIRGERTHRAECECPGLATGQAGQRAGHRAGRDRGGRDRQSCDGQRQRRTTRACHQTWSPRYTIRYATSADVPSWRNRTRDASRRRDAACKGQATAWNR